MLFLRGGWAPWAAPRLRTASPAAGSDGMAAREVWEAWRWLPQTKGEIAGALALLLWPTAGAVCGFLIPRHPWNDLVLGAVTAILGCLMLLLLHRQKRVVVELRRKEKQFEEQTA